MHGTIDFTCCINFRTTISSSTTTNYMKSSSELEFQNNRLITRSSTAFSHPTCLPISSFLRSFLSIFTFPWLTIPNYLSITPSIGRKFTGTLFRNRRGHISFAVQIDPRSVPVWLIELSLSTATLVREMASGLVRIALEYEKTAPARLIGEPRWTIYCNGRKYGYAASRMCNESDGGRGDPGKGAPALKGELLYMRARFERVVGNRDSEAFYMMNRIHYMSFVYMNSDYTKVAI